MPENNNIPKRWDVKKLGEVSEILDNFRGNLAGMTHALAEVVRNTRNTA